MTGCFNRRLLADQRPRFRLSSTRFSPDLMSSWLIIRSDRLGSELDSLWIDSSGRREMSQIQYPPEMDGIVEAVAQFISNQFVEWESATAMPGSTNVVSVLLRQLHAIQRYLPTTDTAIDTISQGTLTANYIHIHRKTKFMTWRWMAFIGSDLWRRKGHLPALSFAP